MLAEFADDTLQHWLCQRYRHSGYSLCRSQGLWHQEVPSRLAKYADALIAFWDGKSKGTQHMIMLGFKQGLKTFVCNTSQ